MKLRYAAQALLILGVLVFAAGVLWRYVLPQDAFWNDEQATELANASEALHDEMHAHGHAHDSFGNHTDASDHPEIVAAGKRYRAAQDELDSALFWTDSVSVYLRYAGLTICVIGVLAYFASRPAA